MIYLITAFLIVILALVFFVRKMQGEIKIMKCQLEASEREKTIYAQQVQRLVSAAGVINENRRQTNEKIDELHTGDSVGNALDGLSKH